MAQDYKVGATFFPGLDDYYMPAETVDILSPAPKRITPEVPANMQHNLEVLELDGQEIPRPKALVTSSELEEVTRRRSSAVSPAEPTPTHPALPVIDFPAEPAQPVVAPPIPQVTLEEPNFSPFPKLVNRPSNVPPTHEEREATLENARLAVLTSSDPEMQLYWAEDALAYADNCIAYERHTSATDGTTRPHTPPSERQLRTDAVNVVTFLAEQGHPKAEFMRGMWFEFGKFGHAQNKPEAFRAYKRAASKGYARAEYRMGLQYESTNEPMKALVHYKAGETLADSASCYRVGMMCLMGQLGQTQDFVAGVRLVRFAGDSADENAPQGAYVFGMLLAGELTQAKVPENFLPLDQVAARKYIEKAAFLGFAKAQVKMGMAYELCSFGCQFDPALSLHYMNLAARQGEPEAEMSISKWFLCGYESLFKKNNELAYKYARRAASSSLDTAEFAMGYFNEVGIQTPVNMNKAREWYTKASKNGSADATQRLEALSAAKPAPLSQTDHEQVALHRIRSQYGSRRGPRPERFTTQPAAATTQKLPRIEDESTRLNTPPVPPPMARTTTPYPLEDRPVPIVERATTTTPYPLGDMVSRPHPRGDTPSSSGRATAFFVSDQRPYSRFAAEQQQQRSRPGLGPNDGHLPSQNTPSNMGPYGPAYRPPPKHSNHLPPPRGPYPPRGNYHHAGPPRPMAAQPGPINHLPPNNHPRNTRPPPPSSTQSLPAPRKPLPNRTSPEPSSTTTLPPADAVPTLPDIGFSAPVDPRADFRNAHTTQQRQPLAGAVRPLMLEARRRDAEAARVPSGGGDRPASSGGGGGGGTGIATATVAAEGGNVRVGKTFEEMGVPSGKKDHDCIVM